MRILFVAPELPHPAGGGAGRMLFQLKCLRRRGIEADLLCFGSSPAELTDELRACVRRVVCVPFPEAGLRRKILDLAAMKAYRRSGEMARAARDLALRANDYSLIHAHKFQMAQYFEGIKGIVPVAVDLWACGLGGAWADIVYESDFIKKLSRLTGLARFYFADKRYYGAFDNFLVVSPEAKAYVDRAFPGRKVYVAPHGYPFLPNRRPESPAVASADASGIIFTGDMSFFPNDDAARFFIREIFPLIKKRCHAAKFTVAGRNPSMRLTALARSVADVSLTGYAPDMGEHLSRAAVFAAPLRAGSGLRTKIVEAMAWGLPVVATPRSLEGIPARDGSEVVVARSSEEFALRVAELLSDGAARSSIGGAARRMVEEKFSQEALSCQIENIYEEILRNNHLKK